VRLSFTARQIHKLELAHDLGVFISTVKLVHSECEYAVGAARILVHLVTSHDFIFLSLVKML